MSSRMDKYENIGSGEFSRTSRNQHIYSSSDLRELSRIKTNTNVSIISDAPKSIDLDKIRNYLAKNDEGNDEKYKRISLELPKEEEVVIVRKEEKDYDIKSVLDRARSAREINYEEDRHRKLNNTQIDILKSIKIKEKISEKRNEELTSPIDELNTEEKTLVNLIQDIQNGKTTISDSNNKDDLFADLMGDMDDTMVMGQKEEISKEELKEMLLDMTQDLEEIKQPANEFTEEIKKAKIQMELEEDDEEDEYEDEEYEENEEDNDEPQIREVDKSFYTNSIMFDKNDFEGFEELEKASKKSSFFAKFAVFIVILMLIGTVFLIVNFVFDLNII